MRATPEVIEKPLSSEELAVRYRAMCEDPCLANVPGKLEVDVWGRMMMTPPSTCRGLLQGRLCARLAPMRGETFIKVPIVTAMGLFTPDAAWASDEFLKQHRGETPLMRAPDLCMEVASPSNSWKELQEKVAAYLSAGAQEVWIVHAESKRWQFCGKDGVMETSRFPVDLAGLFD